MIPMVANAALLGEDVKIVEAAEMPSKTYYIDFGAGKITGFADGLQAMRQAVYLILSTGRFEYPVYSWNYGTELQRVFGQSRDVFESELRRVITEALLADARITAVSDFQIVRTGREGTFVRFTVETVYGNTEVNTHV